MTFKEEVERILFRRQSIDRKINAIDAAHRRHRNLEVETKLESGKNNNTKLSRLLFGKGKKNG